MKRWTVNILMLLSLIICIGTAYLWARSQFETQGLMRDRPRWTGYVSVHRGYATISISDKDIGNRDLVANPHGGWHMEVYPYGVTPEPPRKANLVLSAAGFAAWHYAWPQYGAHRWGAIIPMWSIVAVTAIGPITWVVARERRRRAEKQGLCPVCGYDLRATPGRCPECGGNRVVNERAVAS